MKVIGVAILSLALCACGQNPSDVPMPQEQICRSVWQTGYNSIGELVIGHPAIPCNYNDELPVEVEAVTIPDSHGIIESPLPIGVL